VKLNRTTRLVHKFENELTSVYTSCVRQQETIDWVTERTKRYVFEHPEYEKLPLWAKRALRSHDRAWWKSVMFISCEWRNKWVSELGTVYYLTKDQVNADDEIGWGDLLPGHYFYKGQVGITEDTLRFFTVDFSTE